MPSIVRTAALVLVSIVMVPAQQRPAQETFTAGTRLVLVDFVVSDKADHPVSGLSATDFVVRKPTNRRRMTNRAKDQSRGPREGPQRSRAATSR